MRRIGARRGLARTVPVFVAFAATSCGAPPTPSPLTASPCTASHTHATLSPPGTYTSTFANSVKIYGTETVELTNTSNADGYLDRPTRMQVVVPSGFEDVGSLNTAPSRVKILPADSVELDFGSLASCTTFQPPIWATSITLTFPHLGILRLVGMHMSVLCGAPLLLKFQSTPATPSPS